VAINGTEYHVEAHTEPQASGLACLGYRLTKPDGTAYDVDGDYLECDCPDCTYRQRQCKHSAAVAQLGLPLGRLS